MVVVVNATPAGDCHVKVILPSSLKAVLYYFPLRIMLGKKDAGRILNFMQNSENLLITVGRWTVRRFY